MIVWVVIGDHSEGTKDLLAVYASNSQPSEEEKREWREQGYVLIGTTMMKVKGKP